MPWQVSSRGPNSNKMGIRGARHSAAPRVAGATPLTSSARRTSARRAKREEPVAAVEVQCSDYFEALCSSMALNEAVDQGLLRSKPYKQPGSWVKERGAIGCRIILCSKCGAYFWDRASAPCKPTLRCQADSAPSCARCEQARSHTSVFHIGPSATFVARPSKRLVWWSLSSCHAESFWDERFKGPQPQSEGGWLWRQASQFRKAMRASARSLKIRLERNAKESSSVATGGCFCW